MVQSSPDQLKRLFQPGGGAHVSEVVAYVFAQRVEQLSAELREAEESNKSIAHQRDTYATQSREARQELEGVKRQFDSVIRLAEEKEQLGERYDKFCVDLRRQATRYDFIDAHRFCEGRIYALTAGRSGTEFKPDETLDTQRARDAHRLRLVRQFAKRLGFKLMPLADKKSRSRKKK